VNAASGKGRDSGNQALPVPKTFLLIKARNQKAKYAKAKVLAARCVGIRFQLGKPVLGSVDHPSYIFAK
jgi:hypothetical protein